MNSAAEMQKPVGALRKNGLTHYAFFAHGADDAQTSVYTG
jgi:hypothetical protein